MPQIQFMPQTNQVREHYILAMKCGDKVDLTDFIYFVEECLQGVLNKNNFQGHIDPQALCILEASGRFKKACPESSRRVRPVLS